MENGTDESEDPEENLELYYLALYITLEKEGQAEIITFSGDFGGSMHWLGFDEKTATFNTNASDPPKVSNPWIITESGVYGTFDFKPIVWEHTGKGSVEPRNKQGPQVGKDPWPPPPPPPPPFSTSQAAKRWAVHASTRTRERFMWALG